MPQKPKVSWLDRVSCLGMPNDRRAIAILEVKNGLSAPALGRSLGRRPPHCCDTTGLQHLTAHYRNFIVFRTREWGRRYRHAEQPEKFAPASIASSCHRRFDRRLSNEANRRFSKTLA